jgi:ABC-type nitrate/sulfonate/bicarbonate transport system substrate-binding protein
MKTGSQTGSMDRGLCVIALVFLVCLFAAGARAAEPIKMTIGYQSLWATVGEIYETLRHTNILELNGIKGEFKTFTYGGPIGEAFVAGLVDNVIAADTPVLRAVARKADARVANRTHDWRWGVLALPDFAGKGMADLRGKRLAAPFGTTVFPRTVRKLVQAGVKDPFREMTIINQDIAEQAAAMQGRIVDAVVTWDPTMEKLLRERLGKILHQSEKGDGLGWQALSGEFLKKYGEDGAVRYLKAFVMAVWWASNNIEQAHKWFGETSRIPADLLKVSAAADRYLRAPVKDIKSIDLLLTDEDIRNAQGVMDFLYDRKLLANKMEVPPVVEMSYLKKAQAEIAAGKHPSLSEIRVVIP